MRPAGRTRRGNGRRPHPSPPSASPRTRSRRSTSGRRRRRRPSGGGGAERVLGHGAAHRAVDALGPPGLLVPAPRLARSAPPLRRRRRRPPCAPRRWGARPTPAGPRPGMRRPVRTMTDPPTPSRKIRFGLPTSPVASGVIVAALSPSPSRAWRPPPSCTTALSVARRFSNERSKCTSSSGEAHDIGSEDAQRLVE